MKKIKTKSKPEFNIDEAARKLLEIRSQLKALTATEKSLTTSIKAMIEEIGNPIVQGNEYQIIAVECERSALDRVLIAEILNDDQIKRCTKVTRYVQIKAANLK